MSYCFEFKIFTFAFFVSGIGCFVIHNEFMPMDFSLPASHVRFARLRCLQLYPAAEIVHFDDTPDTHCYVQCFLYKTGLMNLMTRGLDSTKFLDIWDDIEETYDENCMNKFSFHEPLSGKCLDCYRKLMEFRQNCMDLFEYTFGSSAPWKSGNNTTSKSIGQSASEFCEANENNGMINLEDSQSVDISFLSAYQRKLTCLFQNMHFVDAYGRADETEILLTYREFNADNSKSRAVIKLCTHRANSMYNKYQMDGLVLTLHRCLRRNSPEYSQITQLRDEISRSY